MKLTDTASENSAKAFSTHCLATSSSGLGTRPPANSLDAIFYPGNIAVIGASEREGSVGRTVLTNLLASPFGGCVYPINAKRRSVMGVASCRRISDINDQVDLAVIATPAPTIVELVKQCGEKGVKAAVVISAGFTELGEAGRQLEASLLQTARQYGMRLVGPNCLGVMCPASGVNATFAAAMANPGRVAVLSQSGAICTSILDWSLQAKVGFSAVVSLGSMLDVGWGDLLDYFGRDPATDSILLYMESVGDARSFLSAAREVAPRKPIIVIKGGRTDEACKAAASHTGSLAGSDMAFDAATRRVGILRVDRIADVFSIAAVLAQQPRPKGRRLTIVTNAGGPGVLATDALIGTGGKLATLSKATHEQLHDLLPEHWSRNNPIDVLGDADAERYAQTLKIAADDPDSDGLLVILTPQDMTDPLKTAQALRPLAELKHKPVLASWMGGQSIQEAVAELSDALIPNFPFPDNAARAFNYLAQYSQNLRNIYETPTAVAGDIESTVVRISAAEKILASATNQGRTLLSEFESKRLLSVYGIPVCETEVATTVAEAAEAAERIGYPVVLKLHSLSITHKTDVDGVQLNLENPLQVRAAFERIERAVDVNCGSEHFQGVTVQPMIRQHGYELIVGGTLDSQFGPMLMFGAGGQLVEIFRDSAVALPPLNTTLATRLMEQTRIYKALLGTRGRGAVDMQALSTTLINFGNLLVQQPWIKECDINPLVASPQGVMALDARIMLHDPGTNILGVTPPAIRPYPIQYVERVALKDGTEATLRPIRLEDEPMMVRFHESLSDESVRRRYFHLMQLRQRVDHVRLIQTCFNDFDREIVLVAEHTTETEQQVLGVARLSRDYGSPKAEFAMLVSDPWQGRGLGHKLLEKLINVGYQEGVRRISGSIMSDNWPMQLLCQDLGFHLRHTVDDVTARLDLADTK